MIKEEFKNLNKGDLIRHTNSNYVVVSNYGKCVIAVVLVHMSNHNEWDLVKKAIYKDEISNLSIDVGDVCIDEFSI